MVLSGDGNGDERIFRKVRHHVTLSSTDRDAVGAFGPKKKVESTDATKIIYINANTEASFHTLLHPGILQRSPEIVQERLQEGQVLEGLGRGVCVLERAASGLVRQGLVRHASGRVWDDDCGE